MSQSLQSRLSQLADRQDIYDLCCKYSRAIDRRDFDLLKSVYHEDAFEDRGVYRGSIEGFADFCKVWMQDCGAVHHMIGNALIEVEGDVAFGEIYFWANHHMLSSNQDVFMAGRYIDRYERREGVWKIAYRTDRNDYIRQVPVAGPDYFAMYPAMLRGAWDTSDICYRKAELVPGKVSV